MSLLGDLTRKPWEEVGVPEEPAPVGNARLRTARTGLFMLLAALGVMFFLFTISHQWRTEYPDWKAVAEPGLLWFNTLILLAASFALQSASNAAGADRLVASRRWLIAAVALSLLFLTGQLLAWREMLAAGLYASGNPANAYFYVFTGLHALHLLVGLWFLIVAMFRALRTDEIGILVTRLNLCAIYWHFLFLVWLLLFYLLLTT